MEPLTSGCARPRYPLRNASSECLRLALPCGGAITYPRLVRAESGLLMSNGTIASLAKARVDAVRDSTADRYRLAAEFYGGQHAGTERSRYQRAELSFLRWEIQRGVLNAPDLKRPGSLWWRGVSQTLLCDKVEADLLSRGAARSLSSRRVELWAQFIRAPSATTWYRAHNASIVTGYLEHQALATAELPAERFMMNVALLRILYAHALAEAPRLALGHLAPLGRLLGDPRRGAVGLFLDLRNVFPHGYPLTEWPLPDLIRAEGRLARALDYGIISSRLAELYEFAALSLEEPRVCTFVSEGTPCYCWPAEERAPWLDGIRWQPARWVALATGRRHPLR
jgi:hypothetical protein